MVHLLKRDGMSVRRLMGNAEGQGIRLAQLPVQTERKELCRRITDSLIRYGPVRKFIIPPFIKISGKKPTCTAGRTFLCQTVMPLSP